MFKKGMYVQNKKNDEEEEEEKKFLLADNVLRD